MRDQKQWEKDKGFPEKSDAFLRRYRGKFPLLMQEILVKRPKKSNRKASSRKNRLDLLYCSDDCIVEDGFTYSNSNIDGKTTWKLLPNSKSEKNCDSCGKPIAKKMTQDSDEKILLIQRVLQKRIDEHCIDDKHLPYHEYG
ncbi:hypothetical protein KGQ34_02895, partial [Patescibacteria group bacterium]|nr:hypothetical protein [Patescibacteria group bacterium]